MARLHENTSTGLPCSCTFTRHLDAEPRDPERFGKTAGKLHDFLMNPKSRPDLQGYGGRYLTGLLDKHYHSERTDPLMPWLAREVKKGRLSFPANVGGTGKNPFNDTYYDELAAEHGPERAEQELQYDLNKADNHFAETTEGGGTRYLHPRVVNNIADWYHDENHPLRRGRDIMQMTLPEARQLANDYHADLRDREAQENLRRGNVVHSWPDGWTLQDLRDEGALKAEGDAMGHCVGGYQNEVDSGRAKILSLRDPNNQPHTTVELTPQRFQQDESPIEWAMREHPVGRALPDELKQSLRNYDDWVQEGGRHGEPPVHEGADLNALHKEFYNAHATQASPGTPLVQGSHIVQIQGKGNEVPNPEYQSRLKDWFGTYPPEDRPNWEDERGDIEHIGALDPSAETADNRGGYFEGEPPIDDGGWAEGGYGPHGDYGLVEPKRNIDYPATIESLMRQRDPYSQDQGHSSHEAETLYQEALKRGEIPQFAKAAEGYGEKANDDLDGSMDHLYDRPEDPGEYDESTMRDWYESAHHDPVEYHHEEPEDQEEALRDYWQSMTDHYNNWWDEQTSNHAPTQLANDLYSKINRHFAGGDQGYTNELQGDLAGWQHNPKGRVLQKYPPGTEYAYTHRGWGTSELKKKLYQGDESDHTIIPEFVKPPAQPVQPVQPEPVQQTFAKVATTFDPDRYLWAFSPQSGQVHLAHEWDGHPAHVTTHEELGRKIGETNLHHGYAYPISGGYRLFDYNLEPVRDPFITRKVVSELGKEFGHEAEQEKTAMALLPQHVQEYVNQHGPYLEHWTKGENVPGILQRGIEPATHPTVDPEDGNWYDGEEYEPPEEGDVRRNWDGFLQTRNGYTYLARPGRIQPGMNQNHVGTDPYQVPVRVDIRKLDPKNLEADEDAARDLWPKWKDQERQKIRDEEGREPEEWEPDWMEEPPDARLWDHDSQGLGDWAEQMQVGDPEWTRDSLMEEGPIAHYGTVPPEAISLHPDYMHKYPPEVANRPLTPATL